MNIEEIINNINDIYERLHILENNNEKLNKEGIMLCTFRFYDDDNKVSSTRLIVKAKTDREALGFAEEYMGDIVYDLKMEVISWENV